MKIAELVNGLRYMITNEQKELLSMLKEKQTLPRYSLEERYQELADQMTKAGLIDRIYDEQTETVVYSLFNRQQ